MTDREQTFDESQYEVEGTVPSQWWLDLKIENQQLRKENERLRQQLGVPGPNPPEGYFDV